MKRTLSPGLRRVGCISGIIAGVLFTILVIVAIASGGNTDTTTQQAEQHPPTRTAQATHIPTQAPTPTALEPTPTNDPVQIEQPTPTPTPNTQLLVVTFTTTTPGTIGVQTSPGAALTIKVHYNCSNHDATSQSLQGTVYADSGGANTWYWKDQSKCGGTITATVTASLSGNAATNTDTF